MVRNSRRQSFRVEHECARESCVELGRRLENAFGSSGANSARAIDIGIGSAKPMLWSDRDCAAEELISCRRQKDGRFACTESYDTLNTDASETAFLSTWLPALALYPPLAEFSLSRPHPTYKLPTAGSA